MELSEVGANDEAVTKLTVELNEQLTTVINTIKAIQVLTTPLAVSLEVRREYIDALGRVTEEGAATEDASSLDIALEANDQEELWDEDEDAIDEMEMEIAEPKELIEDAETAADALRGNVVASDEEAVNRFITTRFSPDIDKEEVFNLMYGNIEYNEENDVTYREVRIAREALGISNKK